MPETALDPVSVAVRVASAKTTFVSLAPVEWFFIPLMQVDDPRIFPRFFPSLTTYPLNLHFSDPGGLPLRSAKKSPGTSMVFINSKKSCQEVWPPRQNDITSDGIAADKDL